MDNTSGGNDEQMYKILFKEIDLVQACINRMAANSFEIKKWTVGLVAILSGLLKTPVINMDGKECYLFLMIITIFWGLDAFFLRTEKLYREKYSWLIKKRLDGITTDFFNLNPHEKNMMLTPEAKRSSLLGTMFSKTLCPFYLTLTLFCYLIFS